MAYISQRPFLRGIVLEGPVFGGALSMKGNLHFKIDWASLKVARKLIIFALFYSVFEGNFQVQASRGAYIWRGNLTEDFLHYEYGGLIFGGAYTWRGLFFGILRYPTTHTKGYTYLLALIRKYLLWG